MTSKEAIEEARNVFLFENGEETDEWSRGVIEGLEQAVNDLEVLEILKPMLRIRKGNTWECLDIRDGFFNTKEQKTKVKEWLENDK